MAHIERRRVRRPDGSGRVRVVTRYRVRYRDESGRQHCETKVRLVDAERRKAEIELALAGGTWHDPRRGEMPLHEWVEQWLPTRHDLRATTWARLETTMQKQVLPRFGDAPLRAITNSGVRQWVSDLLTSGLSAATTRKAVFALRQCLAAAIAETLHSIPPFPPRSERAIYRRPKLNDWLTRCREVPRACAGRRVCGHTLGRGGRTTTTRH